MKVLRWLAFLLTLVLCGEARAHVGSPNVFFDGPIGPWTAHISIRMPDVVPGQAQITVQLKSPEAFDVSFVPLASDIAVSNAPPPEKGQCVDREAGIYSGELWLMTSGAYSIQVRVHGKTGDGMIEIPVNSIARAQLPLPPLLGNILLVLGIVLICGAVAIVAAAAGEGALSVGETPGVRERRRYWIGATIAAVVLVLAVVGGRHWWNSEESDFRARLIDGGWPDISTTVSTNGSQRILHLAIGDTKLGRQHHLELITDHGKLMHLFMVGQAEPHAFAHLHPIRKDDTNFDVVLPPLPEGNYEVFCDLTFSTGFSSTATNSVQVPRAPAISASGHNALSTDPDDSWLAGAPQPSKTTGDNARELAGGGKIIWKTHSPLRAGQSAGLTFQVVDSAGRPLRLEPYMGMMSHAAVVKSDGKVFSHLHPSGNFSMAAQNFFESNIVSEVKGTAPIARHSDTDPWCGPQPSASLSSTISLPYEFPSPGDYMVWVQIKTEGQVKTAVFGATVD